MDLKSILSGLKEKLTGEDDLGFIPNQPETPSKPEAEPFRKLASEVSKNKPKLYNYGNLGAVMPDAQGPWKPKDELTVDQLNLAEANKPKPIPELDKPREPFSKLNTTMEESKKPKEDPFAPIKSIKMRVPEMADDLPQHEVYKEALINSLNDLGIHNRNERAAFMAQMAHESNGFKNLEEIAGPKQWARYQRNPDLGNTQPGDGERFKGRGFIQLTGRWNYKHYGDKIGVDLISNPQLAADPEIAIKLAHAYWKDKKAGEAARKGDFDRVTKVINPGMKHHDMRKNWYNKYLQDREVTENEKQDNKLPASVLPGGSLFKIPMT